MSDPESPDRFSVDFTGLTLLGQYGIDERIADGGMGSVYRATDRNLGRTVAVKVPHPRFLGEPGFRERFAAEVEELVRLEHPGIVRILARGEHEGVPFFVLQYLGGGSLEDRIGEGGMPPDEVLRWLRPAATTLDYVHGKGIVHRDVKPANILFDAEGHVFLSDFGVAKALQAEEPGLTAPGAGVGSPKYMAPEQGVGEGVGPAADQYGLASAVYEAIAGEPPFGPGDPIHTLVRKQQEEPRPLLDLVPGLPARVSDAVARALSRDPRDRFLSCREFTDAFAEGITTANLPVPAAPPVPRRRWAIPLLVGALLALVVAGFLLLRGNDPPASPPEAGAESGRLFVDLVDAGRVPRQVLRYRVAQGAREPMRMTWTVGTRAMMGEEEISTPEGLSIVFDSDVHVESVGANGVIRYRWELLDCRAAEGNEAGSRRIAEGLAKPLAELVGMVATGRVDTRGLGHDLEFEEDSEGRTMGRTFLQGVSEGLRSLCVPLPEEPVGPGAKWDVTETIALSGMRFTGTTRYELVSVEGYRAEIRFSGVMVGIGDAVAPAGPLAASEIQTTRHEARTEGTAWLDLTQLVPRSTESNAEMEMRGTATNGGETVAFELQNRVRTVMERR